VPLAFEQTAPGRYEGNLAFDGIGEYFITVSGRDSRGEVIEPRTMHATSRQRTSGLID
jgi:hypothetical protein